MQVNDLAEAKPGSPPVADKDKSADAAERQIRRGIDRSRRLVADYRRRLARLALAPGEAERPLFRWRKD